MKRGVLLATIVLVLVVMGVSACAGEQTLTGSNEPRATSSELPPGALETKRLLESAETPQRDLVDLAARFGDPDQPVPRLARAEPWGFEVGDSHAFWVQDKGSGDYRQVLAALTYETPHAYWFVEEGLEHDDSSMQDAAERFESDIYPTNQHYFGREWTPGVDSDPHLVILLTGDLGDGVSAYQNSLDEVPRAVFPFSNEMEMITASVEGTELDDPAFACNLAHEFQHVIQWAADRDEKTWLNEVFGLLACPLSGLEAGYNELIVEAFAANPDVQLNAWGMEPDRVAAQYGASWLFGMYFLERFGEGAVQVLAADPQNGLRSLDSALETLDPGLDADELFADWVIANYLDDPDRYGYHKLDLPPIQPEQVIAANALPVEIEASVNQYATDYILLNGPGQFQVVFSGETLVRPVPAEPHSGEMVWWAGREQESEATLSREFDLTGLDTATLTFHTWYDIDEGYDFAYVAVSTDGRRWTALPGLATVEDGVYGVKLGPGFTGPSGGWIREQIDLTPYAGQKVQVSFHYVTDDGPVRPGFLLDDIEIPELSYQHDAETGDGDWIANGFSRTTNSLPQAWLLQLIVRRGEQTSVERLALNRDNSGRWELDLGSDETAVLAISGLTRGTAEAASYGLWVTS